MLKPAMLLAVSLALVTPADARRIHGDPITARGQLVPAFGQELTDGIAAILQDGTDQCARLPLEYQLHCLLTAYRDAGRKMRGHPDYDAARRPVEEAARKLEQVFGQVADPTAPRARFGGKTYRAIDSAAVPRAHAAALAIVEEAETVLRRAAETSRNRQLHYTQIARAVGSGKVLLRS